MTLKKIRSRIKIFGKKIGMAQYFNQEGNAVPITVIELTENIITDIRTPEKNGYAAVQVGSLTKKEKHLNKPTLGNLNKKNLPKLGFLEEFRVTPEELSSYKIGEKLDVSKILVPKELVDISGTSIGKGFQGMVKLYNKQCGFKSHGSKSIRQIGSIGGHTFPGRVFPGRKMPNRMGNKPVTVRNLEVVEFDKDKNTLAVKGAVPGAEGTLLTIKPTIKKWN